VPLLSSRGYRPIEYSSVLYRGLTPGLTRGQTPDLTRGQTPDLTRGQTPDLTRGQTPDLTRGQTPDLTRGQTPDLTRGQTPDLTRGQTPDLTPEQTRRPTIVVSEVTGTDDRYTTTAAAGWSKDAPGLGDFLVEMGRVQVAASGFHRFLAEQDGEAIATGGLFMGDGIALLAGASTVPRARGRGAQLALLEARIGCARDAGCNLVMIVAAPGSSSQRNAERHGFRIAYTRVK